MTKKGQIWASILVVVTSYVHFLSPTKLYASMLIGVLLLIIAAIRIHTVLKEHFDEKDN